MASARSCRDVPPGLGIAPARHTATTELPADLPGDVGCAVAETIPPVVVDVVVSDLGGVSVTIGPGHEAPVVVGARSGGSPSMRTRSGGPRVAAGVGVDRYHPTNPEGNTGSDDQNECHEDTD